MIQDKMARMASRTYACESMTYMTIGNMERGMKNYHLESAACKIFASESGLGSGGYGPPDCRRMRLYERVPLRARCSGIRESTSSLREPMKFCAVFWHSRDSKAPSEQHERVGKNRRYVSRLPIPPQIPRNSWASLREKGLKEWFSVTPSPNITHN